jgi:hypothetical protein
MNPIDPTNPFTRDLLRSLTATRRAQPNETDAEYAERFAATATALAALHPRDPSEQMLAAQIVSAQYTALDCLSRAAEAEDPILADKHHRTYALMNRAMGNAMRLLEKQRTQPAEALPPPALAPIPPPRRRPPEPKPPQHPIHREKAPPRKPEKDPSKMTDAELEASKDEIRAVFAAALSDPEHPEHDAVMAIRAEDFPEGVYPTLPGNTWESYRDR